MKTKVLFLASSPSDQARNRQDIEFREIKEGIRRAAKKDQFELHSEFAVRPKDLQRAMLDYKPEIVHFSGHGAGEEGIILENDAGESVLVATDALRETFKLFPHVKCVVLNACYTDIQAEAISESVKYVIGMKDAISDVAAIKFSIGFYDALGAGKSFPDAYKHGRIAVSLEGLNETFISVVFSETSEGPYLPSDDFMIVPRRPRLDNRAVLMYRFEIKGFIGRGGFSDTYMAWDRVRDHQVVVKRFHVGQELQSYMRHYVDRETKVVRKLTTSNIQGLVKTYEVVKGQEEVCLVQESISGDSLHGRIERKGVLELDEAIETTLKLGRTLQQLHQLRIAHCDVKPLNIIIESPGNPVLIDLGAARFFDEQIHRQDIVVSIPYSPIELLSGDPIDGRSDIFSLGMTLLHMLTGLPRLDNIPRHTMPVSYLPVGRLPSEEVIDRYVEKCLWELEPRSLRRVIERSLAENLNTRYQSMDEFCRALNIWRNEEKL